MNNNFYSIDRIFDAMGRYFVSMERLGMSVDMSTIPCLPDVMRRIELMMGITNGTWMDNHVIQYEIFDDDETDDDDTDDDVGFNTGNTDDDTDDDL